MPYKFFTDFCLVSDICNSLFERGFGHEQPSLPLPDGNCAGIHLTRFPADQTTIPNRLIDYSGFQKIVDTSNEERESCRLTEEQFLAAMSEKDAVVLDARSATTYQLRHVKGAVNLPFTDFTAASLSTVLPAKDVKILIYCNNNFLGSPIAFASKMPPASLNLSTYTSLKAYGYNRIYELGPLLDVRTTKIPFEGSEVQ